MRVRHYIPDLIEFLAHLNATAPIGILARLDYPNGFTEASETSVHAIVIALEYLQEFKEFFVVRTFLDMKSER